MSSEFVELPLRATHYIATAAEVAHLEATAADNPDEAHLYAESIDRGRLKMQILEEDAADAFVAVAEHTEPVELTRQREMIESLRQDDDFGVVITEEDIQAQLAKLPEFADYDPDVRSFVASYFAKIGEFILVDTAEAVPVIELPPVPVPPVAAAKNNEAGIKPKLTIRIFKDRVIQVGDNGEYISMFRDVAIPKTSEEEAFIADARIQALKTITGVDNVERGIPSREVWEQYAGFAEYATNWHNEVIEPLVGLEYDGKAIIDVQKPTPTAKRRYHSNGAFNVEFVEMDERAPYDNREIIALPSGEYLFGLRARAVHLLLRANEEAPFTTELAKASDLYSPEEQAELVDGVNASSIISYLRRTLEAIDEFKLQSVRFEDRSMGYWLEYTGGDTGLYPFLHEDSDDGAEPGRVARPTTAEAQPNYEKSLAQTSSLATWLLTNKQHLAEHGLPQLEDTHALAMVAQATQAGIEPLETDSVELRAAVSEMYDILSDESVIEDIIEKVPSEDPRWKLIDYLTQASGQEMVITKLIKEFPDLDFQIDVDLYALDTLMTRWHTSSNNDRADGVKYSYDIFYRIGEQLKERDGTQTADFNAVLRIADKRILQTSVMAGGPIIGFSHASKNALVNTYNRWVQDSGRRNQRGLRRLWASELRSVLNSQPSAR